LLAYQQEGAAERWAARYRANINLDFYQMRASSKNATIKTPPVADTSAFYAKKLKWDQKLQDAPIKALAAYQQLLQKDPANTQLQLRIGMLALKLNQRELAREYLYLVYQEEITNLQPDAAWFLALLSIQEGHKKRAKAFLDESIKKGSNYLLQAQQLQPLL